MVEDVGIAVEIVEALGREDHAHVLAAIKERDGPKEEVLARNLH